MLKENEGRGGERRGGRRGGIWKKSSLTVQLFATSQHILHYMAEEGEGRVKRKGRKEKNNLNKDTHREKRRKHDVSW